MEEKGDKVFDIQHIDFYIEIPDGEHGYDGVFVGGAPVEGIAEDGFGISPTSETDVIEALKGIEGFSVDPSNGAEGSLTLVSTSPHMQDMIDIHNEQQAGELPPFEIRVEVSSSGETGGVNAQKATGFSKITVSNAMFVSMADFETDGRDAPTYEFEFVGFGFDITGPE